MLTFTCEPTSEGVFEMVAGDSQLDSACSGCWRKKVRDRNEDVFVASWLASTVKNTCPVGMHSRTYLRANNTGSRWLLGSRSNLRMSIVTSPLF
jgi:hypothetical protein